MLNRREFLQVAAASGATLAVSSSEANSAEPAGGSDGRSAARALSDHRVAKIESRAMQDRFPRLLGPNGKGNPVGGGGGYQVQVISTDQGASGWAMSSAKPEVAHKLIGARLDELFDLASGTTDLVPQEMDRAFHDLVGNMLQKPVYELLGGRGPARWPCIPGRST